jgi:ABC-2 type transport system ATP-binding protein
MMPDMTQHGKAETKDWKPVANTPVIMFDRVSKTYGRINALGGVSLGISGGVTGILGMNGAGKSTMFKLMMGKVKASSGAIRLFGTDPWRNPAPYSRVGFVPEHEKLHDWMTAFDFVTTFARLHGMTRDEAAVEASRVLSFVSLEEVMHKRIGQFSKGMRQRVKIAHALVNDPELIILDEPLQGCDPLARTTIMNVIKQLGAMGRTVLVSSHILHEIERITEQIVILHRGRILALGNSHAIREMLDKHPHKIVIDCENPRELAKNFVNLEEVTGITFKANNKLQIETKHLGEVHKKLPEIIVNSKQLVTGIDNPDDDLQSILMYLTGGSL